jgi:hypothetical protein
MYLNSAHAIKMFTYYNKNKIVISSQFTKNALISLIL